MWLLLFALMLLVTMLFVEVMVFLIVTESFSTARNGYVTLRTHRSRLVKSC